MKKTNFEIITILLISLTTYYLNAQGCSDAGFCTINSFKPNTTETNLGNKNQMKFGSSIGSADKSIAIFGNYIEYNRQVLDNLSIDAKITTLSQSGNGISNYNVSDFYLNGNYKVNEKLSFTLGMKIPFNKANKTKDNLALPMDYQSSLGTFDLILGAGYQINKLKFVIAFQQPLSQNSNMFLAENYPITSKINEFQSTNKFKRSGDVLFRVSYPFSIAKKLKLTSSLLPIYHLSNDKYTNSLGVENDILNSQGLTLNGNAFFDYQINDRNALQLNFGKPFVTRKVRPDGLTRSFIVNLEYIVKF